MKDRNELPEGWTEQYSPRLLRAYSAARWQRPRTRAKTRITGQCLTLAGAIAAAWRIVDAETAKEPKS